MTLVELNSGYAYDELMGGQKIFYRLNLIPLSDLPPLLQEKVRKIEDEEAHFQKTCAFCGADTELRHKTEQVYTCPKCGAEGTGFVRVFKESAQMPKTPERD
jgi:ribosomal protein L37AE/L43A